MKSSLHASRISTGPKLSINNVRLALPYESHSSRSRWTTVFRSDLEVGNMEKQGSWYEPFKLRGEVPNKKPRCPRLGGLVLDISLKSMLSDGLFYQILKPKQPTWQLTIGSWICQSGDSLLDESSLGTSSLASS